MNNTMSSGSNVSLSLKEKFIESAKEIKKTKSLTGVAMLIAMNVVLSFTSINLSETQRISISFIVTAIIGMMYGPVTTAFASGVGDLIRYLVKPMGGFFPGFTITAILEGMVFGMFFYKEKCTLPRVILAKTTVSVLLNCCLNTLWLSIMQGVPFYALFVARAIKNLTLLPIEIVLLYVVLKGMSKLIEKIKS